MARIARRALRIRDVPLFSLNKPWQSAVDSNGRIGLRFFEPRYVEMARRVLPPLGNGKFGYAEAYPPRAGGSGMLAQIEEFRWGELGSGDGRGPELGEENVSQGPVLVGARGTWRFRILSARKEEVVPGGQPLYMAHVQLLEERDTVRGVGREGLSYWESRNCEVKAGMILVAAQGAPVFESSESWRVVGRVPSGTAVVAGGPAELVEGYAMVPIAPSGAVELALFREKTRSVPPPMSTESDVKSILLNFGAEPGVPATGRRKSSRKRRS